MPISHSSFVETYGQAILSGNAAVFIGAGLSRAAGYPDWGALLAPMQSRCSIPDHHDLPLVAEYITLDPANGGRAALVTHILTAITGTPPAPTVSHQILQKLDIKEIWTTNYDRLLETAIPEAVVIAGEGATHEIASHKRAIIKMHGSIGEDGSWEQPPVITRTDYERYELDNPRTWTVLRSSYMSRTMLFLGFSFSDPNIEILLRLARTLGTASDDRHIAIMKHPNGPTDTDDDRRIHELRIMDLENSGVIICEIQNHSEIPDLLADLALRTRPPRLFIAGSANLVDPTPEQDEDVLGPWCAAVASTLVDEPEWEIHSLRGPAGWLTSREVARTRLKEGNYDPSQIVLHFRGKSEPPDAPPERVGTSIYTDQTREQLVPGVLDDCRALVAVRGGSRTAEEIRWANDRRVAVIPIAGSGGAAYDYWQANLAAPPDIGSRPTDTATWGLLNDSDPAIAARAAKRLLEQAMYKTSSAP